MPRVAGDTFAFSDGGAGHVINLGSAPSVGQVDVLVVLSQTVLDVNPPAGGFTARDSNVNQQATYVFDRFASGGEASTVTIDTNGDFPTVVWWERWSSLDAFHSADVVSVVNTNATALPDAATGSLPASSALLVAGCLGDFDGADPTAPVWSGGFGATGETGSVATELVLFGSWIDGASGVVDVDAVTWTNAARDRDVAWVAYTATAGTPEGVLAETGPAATESVAGDVPAVGALAETAPVATELMSGQTAGAGVLAETGPAAIELMSGTSSAVSIGRLRAMPTTTITIYAPSSDPDEWSGERTGDAAAAGDVSASIIEQVRTVNDPRTGTPRVIRNVTGRVPDGTPVAPTSRIVDGEGRVYAVGSVRQARNPLWVGDIVLELYRTDQASP